MEDLEFYHQTTLPHYRLGKNVKVEMPKMIGPYKIDSILHKGSMSILFLATHPETKELIVVKTLTPSLISHPELVTQFLEEAKVINLADHPNIVRVLGQGEWENGPYIAMEFIQGISLRQFISQQSLSLKRSLDIILQVSYALLHLHTHAVIHRDIKPENILITENGKVKVIDFGIAMLTQEKSITEKMSQVSGGMIGTPSYMSPEQKRDPLTVSFNTDIYSLGIITYELILGRLSFGNIQVSLLPKYFRPILLKAVAEKPSDRYEDIVDFIGEVSKYLKSDDWTKDRSGEDEVKEIWESLTIKQQKLLPKELPVWSDVEVGLAKSEGACLLGLYYDFFKMPSGSYLIMLAETPISTIDSIAPIASLRGMIKSLMHPYLFSEKEVPFNLSRFCFDLNTLFYHDPLQEELAIAFIHIDPYEDDFHFVNSGFAPLWHHPSRGGSPRPLENSPSVFGVDPNMEFFPSSDTFSASDLILLHTFDAAVATEKVVSEAIIEYKALSPQTAASALLSAMKLAQSSPIEKSSKVTLVLSR